MRFAVEKALLTFITPHLQGRAS